MRIDYRLEISNVDVPRFSVEAVEGIGKLFTLATLVLNVIENQSKVEIVFHGHNPDDPESKLSAFREIVSTAHSAPELTYSLGEGGQITNSSSHFRWVLISR